MNGMDFFAGIKDHAAIDRKDDDDEKIKKNNVLYCSCNTRHQDTITKKRI